MSRPPPFHAAAEQLGYRLADGRVLFHGITLGFADERTGIVGANGSGKSTLARIIAGALAPTAGSIVRHGTVGFLPQEAVPDAGATVAQELGIAARLAALDRLAAGHGSAADLDLVRSSWDLRERASLALERVGLATLALHRSLGTVSGGEGTRLALAAILLREPDLLVLDEPTNHLDAASRDAVLRLVDEWPRGLVVVSHDRALLSRVDRIVELAPTAARLYGGGYNLYRAQRDLEESAAERDLDAARLALRHTRRRVQETRERKARQDARGKRARRDGSQPKLVLNDKRERSQSTGARLTAVADHLVSERLAEVRAAQQRVDERSALTFTLPPTGLHATKRVLHAAGVSFSHVGQQAVLVRQFDLTMTGPERVALVGANGCGKSTILALIVGDHQPDAGVLQLGVPRDRVAVLAQKVDWPHPEGSLLDNFLARHADATAAYAREALAAFLFRGDRVLQPVRALSGGESLRGAMATLLHAPEPPLLLLLDEPGNHLDLDSLRAVERALQCYDGSMIVISHDEVFLDQIGVTRRLQSDGDGGWQ